MSVKSRIALLVEAQGARRAATDVDRVGGAVGRVGNRSERADRQMRSARGGADVFRNSLRRLATFATVGAVALGAVLGKGVTDSVKGFYEHQKVTKQTAATIRSMGNQAGISAGAVGRLSDRLEWQTGVDGDLVQTGANVLLTFGNIRNEVGKSNKIFSRATSTVTNMSKSPFFNGDTKGAATMLGKALQDPVKGITAMAKAGVSFSQEQKDMIASMVESGDLLGAQKLLLGEVNKQFPKIKATPWERVVVVFRKLQDVVGAAILPILNRLLPVVSKFINQMIEGRGAGGRFVDRVKRGFQDVKKAVTPAFNTVRDAVTWLSGPGAKAGVAFVRDLVQRFSVGRQDVLAFANGLMNVARVIVALVLPILRRIVPAVAQIVRGIVTVIGGVIKVIGGVLTGDWSRAWQGAKQIVRGFVDFVVGHAKLITAPIRDVASVLTSVLGGAARTVWSKVTGWFGKVVGFITGLPGKIRTAATGMWDGIKEAFRGAVNWIIGAWNSLEFRLPGFDPPGPGPKFGGITIGTPDIPQLATGGTVRGRGSWITGEDGAELNTSDGHGGVRVTPLQRAGAGGGGAIRLHPDTVAAIVNGINDKQVVYADPAATARAVRTSALRQALKAAPA